MHTGIFGLFIFSIYEKNVGKEWGGGNYYFKLQGLSQLISLVHTDADLICVCPFQWDRLFFSLGRRDTIKYSNLKITYQSDHVFPPCLVKILTLHRNLVHQSSSCSIRRRTTQPEPDISYAHTTRQAMYVLTKHGGAFEQPMVQWGKSITYSEYVFVTMVIQYAKRTRRIRR